MRTCFKSLTILTLSVSLIACGGKLPSWMIDDKIVLPPAELVDFEEEFEPDVVWSEDVGDGAKTDYTDLSPWLQNGAVVAVDQQGEVNSYQTADGDLNWQIKLEVPVVAGPGVLWNYQRAVPLLSLRGASPPVIYDDRVIAGYANGKLVALSITDGKVIWEQSVAVSRGRTEIDRLVDIDSEPVIKYGRVYVVAYHGNVAAIDIASGQKIWSREMSSKAGLDVDPDVAVYVSDEDSYIWALQDGSGDGLWRQTDLLRRRATAPAIVGDYVIVGDIEGYVHWLSREDGRFVSRMRIAKSAIRSKPIVKDDLVYIIAVDGTLAAVRVPQ